MKNPSMRRAGASVFILATLGWMAAAAAADAVGPFATDWSIGLKSKARLIIAGSGPKTWHAGIEVALAPRTVTYWRMPGEAGSPPRVSVAGSQNVDAADLRFPAPKRIDEDGLDAFGYTGSVIFPLTLTAADPTRPTTLHARFDYAACERICIPVHAEWDQALPGGAGSGPFADAIAAAEAQVPARSRLGATTPLRIDDVLPLTGAAVDGKVVEGNRRFTVDAHIPPGEINAALFAEAPSGWYLQVSRAMPRSDGAVRFEVTVVQAPAGAPPNTTELTLTLTAGARSIEVPATLDSKRGAF